MYRFIFPTSVAYIGNHIPLQGSSKKIGGVMAPPVPTTLLVISFLQVLDSHSHKGVGRCQILEGHTLSWTQGLLKILRGHRYQLLKIFLGPLPLCSPCSYAPVYRVFHRTYKFCSDKLDLQTHLHTQIPVVSFDPTVVLYSISTLISGPKECGLCI